VSATVPEEKVKTSLGKKPPKQSALWTPSPRSLWTSALSGPFGARCCHQVHCMERLPSVGVPFLPLIGRWSSTGDRETPHCGHSSVDSTSTLPVQPPSGVGILWFPRSLSPPQPAFCGLLSVDHGGGRVLWQGPWSFLGVLALCQGPRQSLGAPQACPALLFFQGRSWGPGRGEAP
jgi:hypothetical protein